MEEILQIGVALSIKTSSTPGDSVDLRLLMNRAAELGFEGIELDSRMLPPLTDTVAERFRSLSEEFRLDPLCYVIQLQHLNSGHLQPDQINDQMAIIQHFHMARALGFPCVLLQPGLASQTICKLVPYAQQCGIWLGMEICLEQDISIQMIQESIDLIERLGNKHTGFILSCHSWNPGSELATGLGENFNLSHELLRRVLPNTRIIRVDLEPSGTNIVDHLSFKIKNAEFLRKSGFNGWIVYDMERQLHS